MGVRQAMAQIGNTRQATSEGKNGSVETGLTGPAATALGNRREKGMGREGGKGREEKEGNGEGGREGERGEGREWREGGRERGEGREGREGREVVLSTNIIV